jgi:hypothetical protein
LSWVVRSRRVDTGTVADSLLRTSLPFASQPRSHAMAAVGGEPGDDDDEPDALLGE